MALNKYVKIALWMLLGAILLVALAFGAFTFFIYKSVRSHVMEYTCAKLVEDVRINPVGQKESIESRMRPIGFATSFSGYLLARQNGQLELAQMEDRPLLTRYANELLSICRANPELKPFELFKDVKEGSVPGPVRMKLLTLLNDVKVEEDPASRAFVEIIVAGMAQRAALIRQAQELHAVVSGTLLVSATLPVSQTVEQPVEVPLPATPAPVSDSSAMPAAAETSPTK